VTAGIRLGVRSALVDGGFVEGDVLVDGDGVRAVGVRPAGTTGTAVPGFVDLQVNGFAGVDFLATGVEGYRTARRALARFGVTAFQPTLISSPLPDLRRALEAATAAQSDAGAGARLLGVHLEGPFLAPKWKGAHDERHMVPPDLELADRMCGWGPVTYMTVAPELPGGNDLVAWLVRRGLVVSLGHTDADAAAAHAAYDLGARAVTHLYNAQRRFSARDPGISGVALARADVVVQLIADFVHLAPDTVLAAFRAAGGRLALVTDAIAAAAEAPGDYRLGDRVIHVDERVARLEDGTLAGSVLTMDRAVRNLVSLGVPLAQAVAAATVVPAGLVGRPELGTLRPGTTADIAVLDDANHVVRTLVAGREVWAASG
jgi:N-acetylglucosamine-6-phosphate deacetylase